MKSRASKAKFGINKTATTSSRNYSGGNGRIALNGKRQAIEKAVGREHYDFIIQTPKCKLALNSLVNWLGEQTGSTPGFPAAGSERDILC